LVVVAGRPDIAVAVAVAVAAAVGIAAVVLPLREEHSAGTIAAAAESASPCYID
jgi:hypothetical protein